MDQTAISNEPVRIECRASGAFQEWVARSGGSLMVSTYQAGKVAMIGWDGLQTTLVLRHFDKPLGLAVEGRRLALATRNDLILFSNAPLLAPEYLETHPGRYDALYLPRASYHTGDLHTHDVVFCGGETLLVNTRFSCLARPSSEHNFVPFWRPKFVSDCVPEDRCHLNGLAVRDGRPRYVTALGTSDTPGGWRATKATGGVVVDIDTDAVIADGLAMPHSPRWHQNRLWVLNSGAGELLVIDPETRKQQVACRIPGYLRGLCFVGPFAVVGMCKIREKHIFGNLPIQQGQATLLCAVAVVDLRDASTVGMFEFTAGCEELYDVQFLPGVRRPMILNLEKSAVREAVSSPESSFWLRSSKEISVAGAEVGQGAAPSLAAASASSLTGLATAGDSLPESGTSSL